MASYGSGILLFTSNHEKSCLTFFAKKRTSVWIAKIHGSASAPYMEYLLSLCKSICSSNTRL